MYSYKIFTYTQPFARYASGGDLLFQTWIIFASPRTINYLETQTLVLWSIVEFSDVSRKRGLDQSRMVFIKPPHSSFRAVPVSCSHLLRLCLSLSPLAAPCLMFFIFLSLPFPTSHLHFAYLLLLLPQMNISQPILGQRCFQCKPLKFVPHSTFPLPFSLFSLGPPPPLPPFPSAVLPPPLCL